jgi:hypothetical protein
VEFDDLERRLRLTAGDMVGVGATSEVIEAAEARLAVRFHPSLRTYLARFGWMEVGHRELFGLGDGVPPHLEVVSLTISERTEVGAPLPGRLVPIFNDGGGNLYCVVCDAGAPDDGAIVFWDHDPPGHADPVIVARDLVIWLNELLDDT